MPSLGRACCGLLFLALSSGPILAQQAPPAPLITEPVNETQLTTLQGNTHPLAQPQFDVGPAPPDFGLNRMVLVLKRSPEQDFSLHKLLDEQQDKTSPQFHKWLDPDEFGAQFGVSSADLNVITGWLQTHGFQVNRVSRGRTLIEFSGREAQVEEALHTSIHKYLVNGEEHWANASDPQIPSALVTAVAGVLALHNFPRRPMNERLGSYYPKTKTLAPLEPQFTVQMGCYPNGTCYAVGPADFGAIYNVQTLWNSGIDGTGQHIAIVGESDINLSDVQAFRTLFGLPANTPNIIYNGPNPGLMFDESEADIDVEWSGAIAPNAQIDLVVSQSTETTPGVDLSAIYIIDNNLAPVMSESYGFCELGVGTAGNQFYNSLWAQAAAQGITAIVAAGDSGSAGCDFGFNPARFGLAVSGFASTPFNVAVGGTDFNDFLSGTQYWNQTNSSASQQSAKGYIPETTWDLSCTNSIWLGDLGFGTNTENNCNNPQLSVILATIGGSGGVSNCTISSGGFPSSCAGGYTKPSWQVAPGVPQDGRRDLPDISLFASNGVLNSFYIFCQSDAQGNCTSGQYGAAGGTSFGAPTFAGIMALVNQQMHSPGGQGNANYVLYKLAGQQNPSACNSTNGSGSNCVFNDITSGTIAMPCFAGSPNCVVQTPGHQYGILSGYNTGSGYDLATGLGSLNVANLVHNWSSVAFRATNTSLTLGQTTLTHGQSVNVNATVTPASGSGTPTGEISLLTNKAIAVGGLNLANGSASGTTTLLPGGSYTVMAHYGGDATFGGSDSAPVNVTVAKENSATQIQLVTFDWLGNLISSNATTAVYGSPYLLRVNVLNSAGVACQATPLGSGCATGNVTLTDNGTPLNAGTYSLNSLGYAEDQLVQFPGGNNSVHAQYAGDNSFNTSSQSATYSITPATTQVSTPNVYFTSVGNSAQLSVNVQTLSTGVAPGGTVTFYANGTPVSGTVAYQGTPASATCACPSLAATLNTSPSVFPSPGSYTFTASYSGDQNYGAASSGSTTVSVKYPAPTITTSPNSMTVAANSSVTLTALLDTSAKGPSPSGSVPFIDLNNGTPLSGTETYSSTTDGSGHTALQATFTFTPAVDMQVQPQYAGDQNYPAAQMEQTALVTVNGTDFNLAASPPTLTINGPGSSGSLSIIVGAQSGYNGTLNFTSSSCSGLPAEAQCSFSPASVAGANSTVLTVTTIGPHRASLGSTQALSGRLWLTAAFVFAGVFLSTGSGRRRWGVMLPFLAFVLLLGGIDCGGGGSGSSGPGDPGTPRGSYTVTVTAASGSNSHTTTFNLTVQ